MCTRLISWAFLACVFYGPGVPELDFDITGDGAVDLRDVAEFQNGARLIDDKVRYRVCCFDSDCSIGNCE